MKPIPLWRQEIRRAGWPAALAPPVSAAITVAIGYAAGGAGAGSAALEMTLPLAAGIGAAALIGRDPAAELHLTLPTPYRSTLLRRLACTLAWTALTALLVAAAIRAAGGWPPGHGILAGQLIWLAPALWLAALGLLAAATLRAPAPAAGLVAVVWIVEELYVGDQRWARPLYLFATTRTDGAGWPANRITLLATAAALISTAWLLLGRTERLAVGEPG